MPNSNPTETDQQDTPAAPENNQVVPGALNPANEPAYLDGLRDQVIADINPADAQYQEEVSVSSSYNGPIPDAHSLGKYEAVLPGLAERIFGAYEKETGHRQRMELATLEAQVRLENRVFDEARRGQILAFCIGVIALSIGGALAFYGHEWSGSFLGGSGVVGLVTAFILGRNGKDGKETPAPQEGEAQP